MPEHAFADDLATAAAYRCRNCGYVLDAARLSTLPACPRCGHAMWTTVDPTAPAGSAEPGRGLSAVMFSVRYVVPAVLVLAGLVVLAVNPGGLGVDGFGLFAGAGLSILLLNYLYRMSVSGDDERGREEQAREYYERYGRWPDEVSPRR
jgi:rubredoxin